MATQERENNNVIDVEPIVNRWIVDYYYCLALEQLENKQNADFRAICCVVDSILERQLEDSDHLSLKIRLLQFLSRINEADEPDQLFDSDQTTTPLESALHLLEKLTEEFIIPRKSYEKASSLLKEMIVVTFVKNNQFEKAKDAVIRHFPKAMDGKRSAYMVLISQKNKAHQFIKELSFQRFMGQMLDFCQRLCPFTVPFICKAAQSLAEKRIMEPDDEAARTDEQDQPSCSSCPKTSTFQFRFCEHSIIQKIRLEVAYNALAKGLGEKSFEQLEEEVEVEAVEKGDLCLQPSGGPVRATKLNLEQEVGLQRDTSSPMEASPADQHPQTDTDPQIQAGSLSLYTVSRLVIEPDSQPCSQCTSVPEELEPEVRTETPPQTVFSKDLLDTQCPVGDKEVSIPRRELPRRTNRTLNRPQSPLAESSSDSEEESVENKKSNGGDLHHQSIRSSSRKSKRPSLGSEDSPQECSTPFRTPEQKQAKPLSRCSPTKKSKRPSLGSEDSPQECSTPRRTPEQKQAEPLSRCSPTKDPGDVEDISVSDSSSDNSPTVSPRHQVPQKSSTPHKGTQRKVPLNLKWKELVKEAKESKDTWSDEELHFTSKKSSSPRSSRSSLSITSNSGHTRKLWTESETQKLKEGVKKFGEGNWSKIKAYYSFTDRTNVNLKDRWRTMKKMNLV